VYIHADIFGAGHKGCSFLEGLSDALKTYSEGAPFYNVWVILTAHGRSSIEERNYATSTICLRS